MKTSKDNLLAGAAQAIITPPTGMPLMHRPSAGTHDDLFVRTIVLQSTTLRVVIACLDLVGLSTIETDALRADIARKTTADLVLLNFSHTHSAPFSIPYTVTNTEWFSQGIGKQWKETVRQTLLDTALRAGANLEPAVLRSGRADLRISTNRRLELPGSVLRAADLDGIVPWVDVLRVDRLDASPMAVLFGYAAHPVVVHRASDLISADYPGFATSVVRNHFGNNCIAIFAQGCAGDINAQPLSQGFDAAETTGRLLADAAIRAAVASEKIESDDLHVDTSRFDLALRDPPSADECEGLLRVLESRLTLPTPATPEENEKRWWTADLIRCVTDIRDRITCGARWTIPFEINAVSLGRHWCLLTMPHEMFSEYQRWIDRESPFKRTMVWGYTNGCDGYIPDDLGLSLGGAEAAAFPAESAVLLYNHRIALAAGVEGTIKQRIAAILNSTGASTHGRDATVAARNP